MTTPPPRLLAALAAAALAITLPACGGDDDDANNGNGNGNDAAAADSKATNANTPAGQGQAGDDEAQIRALVASVEQAFKTADGQVICDSLTARGQQDFIAFAKTTGLTGACVEVATRLLKRELAAKTEQRPSKVVAVRVNGDRARALIKIADSTTFQQHYRNIDGQWKVISFNLAATAGIDPAKTPPS